MAVRHGHGKLAGTDALIFAYDTGDDRNSFRGEPTVNLITSPDGNANVITSDIPPKTNVIGYAQYSSGYFVNPRNTTNVAATGKTFTYSVWMRSRSATPSTYLMYVFTGTGSDSGWWYFGDGALTQDWKKYTFTRSNMTGTISQVTVYRHNQLGTIDIAAPQIEEKPRSTQFVNGTRSVTQGLIDLTGRSTIDLSNVSFDSNAQMTFDGTDDVITVPMNNLRPVNGITQEVVVFIDSNVIQVWIGAQYGTGSGNSYALWLNGADTLAAGVNIEGTFINQSQAFSITVNKFYHFVHTYDGTNQRLYANGELIRTWATSGAITYDQNNTLLAIGNDWNGSGYNVGASIATHGKQDITKIYNRALTPQEVQANYSHYRTRFNI